MIENVFEVDAGGGLRCRGIVTEPDGDPDLRRGVLVLGAGVNPRQSWHGLSVKIARRMAAFGFHALRVDPLGVGDSDGEIEDVDAGRMEDLHDKIQAGCFTENAQGALAEFRTAFRLEDVSLVGLCGGALTALYVAASQPSVRRVVYVAGPVTLSSVDVAMPVHPVYARQMLWGYIKRALNPWAWARLVSGKSDYKTIVFLVRHKLLKAIGKERKLLDAYAPRTEEAKAPEARSGAHLNPVLTDAFVRYMRRDGRILFVTAETDPATWGFVNLFAPAFLTADKRYKGRFVVESVNKANHTFSSIAAQTRLLGLIQGWLCATAGAAQASRVG